MKQQKAHRVLFICAIAYWAATFALAPSGAARGVEVRAAAETVELEGRMAQLQRRAERAEAEAAWHGKRAEEWAEIAGRQDAPGDVASGREPLADFNADTHRRQRRRKLRRANQLRQELSRLQQRASELRSYEKPKDK
ncbi:MAG: hypothetical protein ACR2G4_10005 [Pyrinomonadaceae bacterium]